MATRAKLVTLDLPCAICASGELLGFPTIKSEKKFVFLNNFPHNQTIVRFIKVFIPTGK